VEAQFTTRGITAQKTKFNHIVTSLSSEIATEVRDLILKPLADNPYDNLRCQLIKRTIASEQRRLQQLFNTEELATTTPYTAICWVIKPPLLIAPSSVGSFSNVRLATSVWSSLPPLIQSAWRSWPYLLKRSWMSPHSL
jgi:hypothetical protein